jgi:fluoride exporter
MSQAAIVGVGGFIGAIMRFGISGLVHTVIRSHTFPWGTLTVNVSGCLLIGLLGGVAESRHLFSPDLRLFLLLGVLGGFTTFSTFGFETLTLMRDADYLRAILNVSSHVALGLAAVWVGLALTKAW